MVHRLSNQPKAGAIMPIIRLIDGDMQWPLLAQRFTIGRDSNRDVVLISHSVNRCHALITRISGHWFIEDGDGLGRVSHGGVFVNNQRLSKRHQLNHLDVIKISNFHLQFLMEDESQTNQESEGNGSSQR
jgi:pSer/pThr/pTyr-binding forkhead associated (FHA) protein